MIDSRNLGQRIQQRLQQARRHRHALVSVTLPLPGATLHSLPQVPDERYFWMRPDRGEQWLGLGNAWRSERPGEGHLGALSATLQDVTERLWHADPEACGVAPRLSLVSDSRGGRITLPSIQLGSGNHAVYLTVTPDPAQPDAWMATLERLLTALDHPYEPPPGPLLLSLQRQEPNASVWIALAERAVKTLAQSTLQKVVLARSVSLTSQRPVDAAHLVRTLACQHAHCTIFAADVDDGCWVGASPEVLLNRHELDLFCEAVAGTVRRDPYQTVDQELGEWLLRDAKNRHEHELVVDSLRAVLEPLSMNLTVPREPSLLRLHTLQHLYTPLRATLKENTPALEIAQALHPSPAICGSPRLQAQSWLQEHEPMDRAWFTGLSGWVDTAGGAALNVVLRCAHLRRDRVNLYAGAGLVADSVSAAEWDETEIKLDSMIQALKAA